MPGKVVSRINHSLSNGSGVISHLFIAHLLSVLLVSVGVVSEGEDNRCYLTNGGSSETFIVNEALPVDSVLGRLEVDGNPNKDGDIVLSLKGDNHPISIEPYSTNLILKKPLDKEGLEGIQSVMVDISCSKKKTSDPSIIIPVRIIVTDANDNAPRFIGTPYTVDISEATVVGTVVMQSIKAVDDDQAGPFSTVEYFIEDGPHSDLLRFESRLGGFLVLNSPLNFETLRRFTVTIITQDQGDPPKRAFTTLTVHVVDADDQNPKFQADKYTALIPENPSAGMQLEIAPSPIQAEDPDVDIKATIKYSFSSNSREYSYFELDGLSGNITILKAIPQNLPLPLILVIKATQVDNKDRYSITTLTVFTDQKVLSVLRFLQTHYVTTVSEDTPIGAQIMSVQTSKYSKDVQFTLFDDPANHFSVRNTGEIVVAKPLDFERQQQLLLGVIVSDGNQSDTAHINITVTNVNDNDPVFTETHYTFVVKESEIQTGMLIGKVEVTDEDVDDIVDLKIKGKFSKVFEVSSDGEIRIDNLELLNTSVCHVFVVATDSGDPPRQTSVPLIIHFPILENKLQSETKEGFLVIMVVFGVLFGLFLLVVTTLTIYILKRKQYLDHHSTATEDYPSIQKITTYTDYVYPANNQSHTDPVGKKESILQMVDRTEADVRSSKTSFNEPVSVMLHSLHSQETGISLAQADQPQKSPLEQSCNDQAVNECEEHKTNIVLSD
ncbi:protocadherin-15-like [Tachypleus tridentatus]|uniref:protocadherin-15-like n=1 Tax=Tachypleus tridentatus TaxID=6853 RepID=UPI003FCEEA8A